MAIFQIHPFADGNGRVGRTLLSRELELVGQVPFLLPRKNEQLHHRYAAAIRETQSSGDLSILLPIIFESQQFVRKFCLELSQS